MPVLYEDIQLEKVLKLVPFYLFFKQKVYNIPFQHNTKVMLLSRDFTKILSSLST